MKKCPCCSILKRTDAFYVDKSRTVKNKRSGYCKTCILIKAKIYRSKHRERVRLYLKQYYTINLSQYKERHLKQCYGLTLQDFVDMADKQKGKCAICDRHHSECPKGKGERRIRLYVDHDHATGHIRGLLCHTCNSRLDASSTPAILRKSAAYLQRSINKQKQL